MECLNKLLRKVKSGLIITLVLMMCITTQPSFAAEPAVGEEPTTSTEGETNLPHIDMKVKQVKVKNEASQEESSQVLVECWASKMSNLEQLDITFTYNNMVLEPSYINGDNKNEILSELSDIKYANRPEVLDPSTGNNIDKQTAFNTKSKNILSNSFEITKSDLEVFAFQYCAPEGNTEALEFAINTQLADGVAIEAEEVLIGTFSFRKIGEAADLDGVFGTNYIAITPSDDAIRDKGNGENCEELITFVYEKYGSISGKITASMKDEYGNELNKNWNKPTVTLKLYEEGTVDISEWYKIGAEYINCKMDKFGEKLESRLPSTSDNNPPYVIESDDEGNFKIENVYFGTYDLLIDKDYYADVIITNIKIDSNHKDIDLVKILNKKEEISKDGTVKLLPGDLTEEENAKKETTKDGYINLIPGDIDNDGKMNPNTDPILFKKDAQKKKNSEINLDEIITRPNTKNANSDAIIFKAAATQYKSRNKQVIKRVIKLTEEVYE